MPYRWTIVLKPLTNNRTGSPQAIGRKPFAIDLLSIRTLWAQTSHKPVPGRLNIEAVIALRTIDPVIGAIVPGNSELNVIDVYTSRKQVAIRPVYFHDRRNPSDEPSHATGLDDSTHHHWA